MTKDIKLTLPSFTSSGKAIPLTMKSDLNVKSIVIFQDANPESAVAVFTINEESIVDYKLKIKMAGSGVVTVVAQGNDGKLYFPK